jgi:hypothetical protein
MSDDNAGEVRRITSVFVILAGVGVLASVWPEFDAFMNVAMTWFVGVIVVGLAILLARELL